MPVTHDDYSCKEGKLKTFRVFFLLNLVWILTSCHIRPAIVTPFPDHSLSTQEVRAILTLTNVPSRIPSTSTLPPQKIQTTATIHPTIPVTQTPIIDLNVSLETGKFVLSDDRFTGNLYIGSDHGVHLQFDFDENRISQITLPESCQLLATGKEAICRGSVLVNGLFAESYSLFTVSANEKQNPFINKYGKWILTSFGRLIESLDSFGEIETIEAYDLVTNEVIQIGTFEDRDDQFSIPFLSNSGTQMVGVEYGNDPWLLDSRWYFMEKGSMTPESILIPEPLYATTDSVAWAPDDSKVVLLAAWDDVETHSEGPLCGKEILLFDPATQAINSIGGVPTNRCISEFPFYSSQVWSPDSSKFVMVLDQQDICIKDLSQIEIPCQMITNNYGSDSYVRNFTWSVDSQWLAYMIGDTRLQVYSIQENKTYVIADFKGSEFARSIGMNMVWGK